MKSSGSTSLLDDLADLQSRGIITQSEYRELSEKHRQELKAARCTSFTAGSEITMLCNLNAISLASEVFNIPELLEIILSHLPERDLRKRVLLVCKGFQTAIRSSVKLRRILFLAPDWKCVSFRKPLRRSLFLEKVLPYTIWPTSWPTSHNRGRSTFSAWLWFSPFEARSNPRSQSSPDHSAADSEFRSLLICQPPIIKLEASGESTTRDLPKVEEVMHCREGATYGQVFDLIAMVQKALDGKAEQFQDGRVGGRDGLFEIMIRGFCH